MEHRIRLLALSLAAGLLAGGLLAAAAPDPAEDRAPRAIYKPNPQPPLETAGSGLGPLVRAKLSIDARGKVTAAAIESVEPSSSFDPLFRKAARETLLQWRFRPALRDGEPAPTDLTVSIRFEPRTFVRLPWQRSWALSVARDEERFDRRRRLLALPEEQRRRILEDQVARAEAQINGARRKTARSEHFEVVTDAPAADAAEKILERLEAVRAAILEIFSRRIPAQPATGRIRAYVYAARQSYQGLRGEEDGFEWSAGFYSPAGLLAFHMDWPSPDYALVCLFHEAAHALVDRYLVRPGVSLPRWLDEGFAEYMGYSRIEEGRLLPGSRRTRLSDLRFPPPAEPAPGAAGEGVPGDVDRERLTLAELLRSDREAFSAPGRDLYYVQSWMAVHFLRHGRRGWSDDEFPRFMLYAAEGFDAGEAFRQVYDLDPAGLEREFRRYAERF